MKYKPPQPQPYSAETAALITQLKERIKRLEEAGDALANNHNPFTFIDWQRAKEDKP